MIEFGENRVCQVQVMQQAPATQKRRDAFESHRHRVFALAFYMTGGENEAEDVMAGTFTRVFRTTDEPTGQQVDAQLVSELRDQIEFENVPATAPPATYDGMLMQQNVKRPDLEAALGGLPPTERIVFLLRDVEAQPAERVAQTMQISIAQVNVALLRARLSLRRELLAMAMPKAS